MPKVHLIPTLLLTLFLTACGQKGALYFPEKQLPKDTTSEMPTQTADNANNPNDLTNVQNPNQITPAINPNAQNPNIKIQDTKHDY